MKLHRIQGLMLKTFFLTRRSWDRISDVVYWSIIDLAVWGLTGQYFTALSSPRSHILEIIVSGILFWLIIWRGQQEISVNLLEDLWNKNMVNLFVAPLTFAEWVMSFLLVSIVKVLISFLVASFAAELFYHINIFAYGWYLLPVSILLLINSWWIGFVIAGMILRFGTKMQTLAWSIVSLLAPFSAIYYPVGILPKWGQFIAEVLPTSYLFTALHAIVVKSPLDVFSLEVSLVLSFMYLALSLVYLKSCFNKVLERGLVKLN
ncbi:MAG TPA: ABC transporter permease [Patescibacteria group bacterium]|nr:ABC transporter permease [Patescibacteria group bacterium]